MQDDSHPGDQHLADYVERMVALSNQAKEISAELAAVRRTAKGEGYDLDALNLLVQVRMRAPKDNGSGLIVDLLRYSRATGTSIESEASGVAAVGDSPAVVHAQPSGSPGSGAFGLEVEEPEAGGNRRGRVIREITLGIAVSVSLLWALV
ncbi:MAG: DUF2312 domain-containing protein [Chromatiales bacterium]|nr:DUF2312 domain-containing protein [Chromatiales bacterium]